MCFLFFTQGSMCALVFDHHRNDSLPVPLSFTHLRRASQVVLRELLLLMSAFRRGKGDVIDAAALPNASPSPGASGTVDQSKSSGGGGGGQSQSSGALSLQAAAAVAAGGGPAAAGRGGGGRDMGGGGSSESLDLLSQRYD